MKTIMKRKILLVIAAVLVLSLSVGFASAYFSDHETASGTATIKLGGQTEIIEDWDQKIKHVSIKNIGETDVVVRVAFYGPADMEIDYGGKWVPLNNYYYYDGVLQPGQSTDFKDLMALIDKIPKNVGDNFDIVVMQECKQAPYDENGQLLPMSKWFETAESEEGGE